MEQLLSLNLNYQLGMVINMQEDFHFYTTYVLCRCNGLPHDKARTIAYSSQQVDDAKYGHELEFKEGGRFQQQMTAHQLIHSNVLNLRTQYEIYGTYHFIPGNRQDKQKPDGSIPFRHRMLCTENSEVSQKVFEHVYQQKKEPDFFHSLGIALHAYADTWAHQDFSALFKFEKDNKMNDANHVMVCRRNGNCYESFKPGETSFDRADGKFQRFLNWLANRYEVGKMGHCQVYTLPDEPYRKWKYYNRYLNEHIERDNVEIYLDASKAIYGQLKELFSKRELGHHATEPIVAWNDIKGPLQECFSYESTLEKRNKNWLQTIVTGDFGFAMSDRSLDSFKYDKREWFYEAVQHFPDTKKLSLFEQFSERFKCFLTYGKFRHPSLKETYSRKESFLTSDWKLFHDAARKYKDFFIHELLQGYGMICG